MFLKNKVEQTYLKFPILIAVVELSSVDQLSKDAKLVLFITRQLDFLYTEEFMANTTGIKKERKQKKNLSTRSTKGQLPEKELQEIISNINNFKRH